MKISDMIMPVLFGTFVFVIVCAMSFILGKEALSKGIIELEDNITVEQKATAIEIAKKAVLTHKLNFDTGWHSIELIRNEWESEDADLEIRYCVYDKEPIRFFVIVRPKEKIGGITISSNKKSMTLGLGKGRDVIPANGLIAGGKIISGFGIIHTLSSDKEGFLALTPPITDIEAERNLILVEDPKATIDTFEIESKFQNP